MTTPAPSAASPPSLQWQPIESAPKDGTWIVVVGLLKGETPTFRDMPRACVSRWFTEDDYRESPSYCPGWYWSSPGYSSLIEPTHWMPLPPPPQLLAQEPPAATMADAKAGTGEWREHPCDSNVPPDECSTSEMLRRCANLIEQSAVPADFDVKEWTGALRARADVIEPKFLPVRPCDIDKAVQWAESPEGKQILSDSKAMQAATEPAATGLGGRTPWEFACAWYTPDEIERTIKEEAMASLWGWRNVPENVYSRAFAEWLTDQYRLAMRKGIEIGIAALPESREVAELRGKLEAAESYAFGLRETIEEIQRGCDLKSKPHFSFGPQRFYDAISKSLAKDFAGDAWNESQHRRQFCGSVGAALSRNMLIDVSDRDPDRCAAAVDDVAARLRAAEHRLTELEASRPKSDDGEPITAEFLLSLGFTAGNKWPNGYTYMELKNGQSTITVSEPVDSEEEWCVGGERIPHPLMPELRGNVRRLLHALAIPDFSAAEEQSQ